MPFLKDPLTPEEQRQKDLEILEQLRPLDDTFMREMFRNQLELAQQSAAQAEENLRIHRNTYRAGTATMTDLLQAQLLQQQARDQQTEAFTALQLARLDYRQVTR